MGVNKKLGKKQWRCSHWKRNMKDCQLQPWKTWCFWLFEDMYKHIQFFVYCNWWGSGLVIWNLRNTPLYIEKHVQYVDSRISHQGVIIRHQPKLHAILKGTSLNIPIHLHWLIPLPYSSLVDLLTIHLHCSIPDPPKRVISWPRTNQLIQQTIHDKWAKNSSILMTFSVR